MDVNRIAPWLFYCNNKYFVMESLFSSKSLKHVHYKLNPRFERGFNGCQLFNNMNEFGRLPWCLLTIDGQCLRTSFPDSGDPNIKTRPIPEQRYSNLIIECLTITILSLYYRVMEENKGEENNILMENIHVLIGLYHE